MVVTCTQYCSNRIFYLNSKNLSLDLVERLRKILSNQPKNFQIALNLQNVDSICADFLDFLKEFSSSQKLSLISMQSDVFVLLNLTKHDKFANIFLSEVDFIENKGLILNRRFSVLGNS